jgi:serine/threonine protein kinase
MFPVTFARQYSVEVPQHIGDYTLLKVIGSGSFAVVFAGVQNCTNSPIAAKVISKQYLIDHKDVTKFEREVTFFASVDHPNIVKFIEVLNDDNLIYIIMEFCNNGSLHTFILSRGAIPESAARKFVVQILEAIQYLHSRGIAHRDLKPENILIGADMLLKVADFGFAASADSLLKTQCGSPIFTAPEIISGRAYDGKCADMWSLGVIVYWIVTGKVPWTDIANQSNLFYEIQTAQFSIPDLVSQRCAAFISGLMNTAPVMRFTVDQALVHPWISQEPGAPAAPFSAPRMISKSVSGDAFVMGNRCQIRVPVRLRRNIPKRHRASFSTDDM